MQRAAVLAAAPLLRAPRARVLAPARQMSGGAYDGFHIHRPAALNSRVAKVVATTMWTWMMYRGYHDLGHMLVSGGGLWWRWGWWWWWCCWQWQWWWRCCCCCCCAAHCCRSNPAAAPAASILLLLAAHHNQITSGDAPAVGRAGPRGPRGPERRRRPVPGAAEGHDRVDGFACGGRRACACVGSERDLQSAV